MQLIYSPLCINIYPFQKENIFTVPNLLTFSRIVATPFLGYMVLHEHFHLSLGIFACAGITDLVRVTVLTYILKYLNNSNKKLK